MANEQNQRNDPENLEQKESSQSAFNAGGNDSDYDGGQPKDTSPGSEGRVDADSTEAEEKENKKSFNSGGNDSDYDGGQPQDAQPGSEGRVGK